MKHRLCIALALALMTPPMAISAETLPNASTMNLSATGSASADPDRALITLGMESTGKTAGEAMQMNSNKMARAFDALAGHGLDMDDLSTSAISLSPRYDNRQNQLPGVVPEIIGYHVSNQLVATIKDVDTVGAVLDSIVGAGINSIRSIQFDVADKTELYDQARRNAALEVGNMARIYTETLGATIIGIVNVSESQSGRQPMYRAETMMMSDGRGVPVAAGDVDVSVTVSVTYSLSNMLTEID
jgi:uncharacterized protein YggE